MIDFKKGMLVQHTTLGVGKVVALDQKVVHVFFAQSADSFATKLRLAIAQPYLSVSGSADRWLTGLSGFAFDEKAGRYRVSDAWISDADAVARFTAVFPDGFRDPKYTGDGKSARERSARWRRAHEAFAEALGAGEGERLLAAGDVTTLVERARLVERQVRVVLGPTEKALFTNGLADAAAARGYFAALFDLLSAPEPDEARFEALASAAARCHPEGEASWTFATLLPFVARPDRYMLLRANVTCEAARRLRLEVDYRPQPGWSTYSTLLKAAAELLEKLRPLGARDYMDAEAFLHVATAKHPRKALRPQAS
jgi:hypothetical protein